MGAGMKMSGPWKLAELVFCICVTRPCLVTFRQLTYRQRFQHISRRVVIIMTRPPVPVLRHSCICYSFVWWYDPEGILL